MSGLILLWMYVSSHVSKGLSPFITGCSGLMMSAVKVPVLWRRNWPPTSAI
jgi:hypothetical protein